MPWLSSTSFPPPGSSVFVFVSTFYSCSGPKAGVAWQGAVPGKADPNSGDPDAPLPPERAQLPQGLRPAALR